MNTRRADEAGDGPFIIDDVFEDAMAAYRELEAGGSSPSGGNQPEQSQAQRQGEQPSENDGADEQPPEGETAEQHTARENRDNKGRFTRKATDGADKGADAAQAGKDGQQAAQRADDASKPAGQQDGTQAAAAAAPPPSWGVKAKAAWDSLPEAVRAEIGKRDGEVQQGLRALQDYNGLEPYAQTLKGMGGSVKQAMDHYTAVDRLLNQDLAGGLGIVAESYNKDRAALGRMFADIARRYGAAVPNDPQPASAQLDESDPLAAALKPFLQPLLTQINDLKSQHSQRGEADRNAQVQTLATEIQRFAADPKNVYFANVEGQISKLFASGMVPNSGNPRQDLQTAYEMAIRLNPEIQETLIEKRAAERLAAERQKEQEKAAKARQASRSVGGSRMPGLMYQKQQQEHADGHDDVEADVIAAYRAHAS